MSSGLRRGEICRVRQPQHGDPKRSRCFAVVSRQVLDRKFDASEPNSKWAADFTYIWTTEGWLYVAAAIDLFSRRVVGWSMSSQMTAQLVTDAMLG